jgi:hypothetical protein
VAVFIGSGFGSVAHLTSLFISGVEERDSASDYDVVDHFSGKGRWWDGFA